MAEQGLTLLNKALIPPHHVSADSYFVKTLLAAFELYTGRKGECQALGGGTMFIIWKMAWHRRSYAGDRQQDAWTG